MKIASSTPEIRASKLVTSNGLNHDQAGWIEPGGFCV
jgi:hypothetical protein